MPENTSNGNAVMAEHPPVDPWSRRLVFFGLLTMDFFGFACYAVMGPIFPPEGERKGVPSAIIGMVFSAYSFTMLISSPIFGHHVSGAGPKAFLIGGGLLNAVATICFGFLKHLSDTVSFTVACFIGRFLEAVGFAALNVAVFAIVGRLYPTSIGFAMSYVEIAIGFGQAAGPAIASALFSVGGYTAPFAVLGGTQLLICIGMYFMIKYIPQNATASTGSRKHGESLSLWKFLKIPSALITLLSLFSSAIGATVLIPLLAIHLQDELGLLEDSTGYVFSAQVTTYAFMSILTGKLSDKYPKHRYLMLITGMGLIALSLVFLGPSPLLPLLGVPEYTSVASNVLGLACLGTGSAFVFTPTYQVLFDSAVEAGYEQDTVTLGVVGGSWNASFTLGSMTAPTIGALLQEKIGYRWTSTVGAAFPFTFMIVTSVFVCSRRLQKRGKPLIHSSGASYQSMNTTESVNEVK